MVLGSDFEELFEKPSEAAEEIEDWVGIRSKKKTTQTRWNPKRIERIDSQLHLMLKSGDWEDVKAEHLVSLYKFCHHKVYGVRASEIDGFVFPMAAKQAAKLVENEFNGDFDEAIRFIQWLWIREKEREKWRRENGKDGGAIGWRYQFSVASVPQYRIYLARKAARSI